jgi:hypothetical protein
MLTPKPTAASKIGPALYYWGSDNKHIGRRARIHSMWELNILVQFNGTVSHRQYNQLVEDVLPAKPVSQTVQAEERTIVYISLTPVSTDGQPQPFKYRKDGI